MSEKRYRSVEVNNVQELKALCENGPVEFHSDYWADEELWKPAEDVLKKYWLADTPWPTCLKFRVPIEDAQEEGWERISVGSVDELKDGDQFEVNGHRLEVRGDHAHKHSERITATTGWLLNVGFPVFRKVEPKEEGPIRFQAEAVMGHIRTPDGCQAKKFECIEVKEGYSVVVCKGEPVYRTTHECHGVFGWIVDEIPIEWAGKRVAVCLVGEKP